MSETVTTPATKQDLNALVTWLLSAAALISLSLALTFGVGTVILASTQASRGGVGLCLVFAVASTVSCIGLAVARDDPRLREARPDPSYPKA